MGGIYTCDGCGKHPIDEQRWHCNQCIDFDLCVDCKHLEVVRKGCHHKTSHTLTEIVSLADHDRMAQEKDYIDGHLIEVVISEECLRYHQFKTRFVKSEGIYLREEAAVTDCGQNEDDDMLDMLLEEPAIPVSHILRVKPLDHPMAFELHTHEGTRVFLYSRYTFLRKMQPLLVASIPRVVNRQVVTLFHHDKADPAKYLNDDAIRAVFSHFHTNRDFQAVLLVSKGWNERFVKVAAKMVAERVRNRFIEHGQNFSVRRSGQRERVQALFFPALIEVFSPKIDFPETGNYQTWKFNIALWSGKWYYEVMFRERINILRMGWISPQCPCKPIQIHDSQSQGVGDDPESWGYDPVHGTTYHNQTPTHYTPPGLVQGDVFGCLLDLDGGVICFTKNGHPLGVAYQGCHVRPPYYPGVTKFATDVVVAIHKENIKFLPDGFCPVADGIREDAVLVEGLIGKMYLGTYGHFY